MIIEKQGDLLQEKDCIIAHQVNCKGVMGAGIAKQIREKLFSKKNYQDYQELCRTYGNTMLGHTSFSTTPSGVIVANVFAENQPTGKGVDTDYEALTIALKSLRNHVTKQTCGEKNLSLCNLRQKVVRLLNNTPEDYSTISNEENRVYGDMQNLMESIDFLLSQYAFPDIAIPKNMGCGLAGGDWNYVYHKILVPLFDEHPITLRIVEYHPGQ